MLKRTFIWYIPVKNIAIIQPKPIIPQQQQPQSKTNTKKGECILPNGEVDTACLMRKIMPGVMRKVNERINNIPIQY